jgi:fatty acid desaturase
MLRLWARVIISEGSGFAAAAGCGEKFMFCRNATWSNKARRDAGVDEMSELSAEQFPLDETRDLVRGLFNPNPTIYWSDFLFSVIVGWGAFIFAVNAALFSVEQVISYFVASFALYRAVIFTHELAHFRANTFGFFRFVWNMTCGFPMMVPSYTYRGVHGEHHKQDIYGTGLDGEYLPFALRTPRNIVTYLLLIFLLPILAAGRFVVVTPLTYLSQSLARLVWARASSLCIDLNYVRGEATKTQCPTWPLQQLGAFAYGATAIALVALGWMSAGVLLTWYLVSVFMFLLNSLRTLAAHCYRNPEDRHMSVAEQFLDSVDVPGNRLLTTLWAPVGLRYHATHHLFPSMPYHSLGRAHRLLVDKLSDNRLYLEASRESLWDALHRLWREAGSTRPEHA